MKKNNHKKNFEKIVKKLLTEIDDRENLLKTKLKTHIDGEMERYVDWLSGKSMGSTIVRIGSMIFGERS